MVATRDTLSPLDVSLLLGGGPLTGIASAVLPCVPKGGSVQFGLLVRGPFLKKLPCSSRAQWVLGLGGGASGA